jgi:hypothetical protein
MGTVNNAWLTKNIFMGYLAAKDPISEKVRLGKCKARKHLIY